MEHDVVNPQVHGLPML